MPVIREHAPGAEVSITLNPTQVWGPEDGDDRDADAVRRADNALNGLFFGPLFHGAYPDGFLDDTAHLTDHAYIHDGDLATISTPLDNLGVNNYSPTRVRAARDGERGDTPMPGCDGVVMVDPRPPLTDMGWEQSPQSHRLIIERSARECGLPVYITENGSAWPDTVSDDGRVHDPERVAYLQAHLGAVADAIDGGTDVRGYFAWSLLDNFEWAYGYDKRFGIVHVDYDTQVRTVKDSGREYARIVAAHHDSSGSSSGSGSSGSGSSGSGSSGSGSSGSARPGPAVDLSDAVTHPRRVAVVGGGIIGLAVAERLLREDPSTHVTVLEKEQDWARHQTGRNSGVIHSGLYYPPGSLKARWCRAGAAALVALGRDEGVPHAVTGKLVVATASDELERLAALEARGLANGLRVSRLTTMEAHEHEPHVAALAALRVPETGIIDYRALCAVLVRRLRDAGARLLPGTEVVGGVDGAREVVVETTRR